MYGLDALIGNRGIARLPATHHQNKRPPVGLPGPWLFAEMAVVAVSRNVRLMFFRIVTFETLSFTLTIKLAFRIRVLAGSPDWTRSKWSQSKMHRPSFLLYVMAIAYRLLSHVSVNTRVT
jgi:hypothetical protein